MDLTTAAKVLKGVLSIGTPNYLIVFVNGDCNYSCHFCCYAATTVRKEAQLDRQALTRSLKGIRSLVHITFTGGEPSLREDLADLIIDVVTETRPRQISIHSNGSKPDALSAHIGKILAHIKTYKIKTKVLASVSIDGPEEIHDRVRKAPDGYRKALASLAQLALLKKTYANLQIRVQSVITKNNHERLSELIAESASWPIDGHSLSMQRDAKKSDQLEILPTYLKLCTLLASRKGNGIFSSINLPLSFNLPKKIAATLLHPKDRRCSAGRNLLEIMPNGEVKACEMKKVRDTATLGNIHSHDIKYILNNTRSEHFRKTISNKCHCIFECAMISDRVFMPFSWLRF